jgi:NTE family protein
LFLRPKRDLGRLAADVYRTNPPRVGGAIDRLLAFSADRAATDGEESDLLSYLLFDGAYTGAVEALGFEEAKAREEEIVRFLTEPGAWPA